MGCLKRIELSYPLPQSGALTTKLQAPRQSLRYSLVLPYAAKASAHSYASPSNFVRVCYARPYKIGKTKEQGYFSIY